MLQFQVQDVSSKFHDVSAFMEMVNKPQHVAHYKYWKQGETLTSVSSNRSSLGR